MSQYNSSRGAMFTPINTPGEDVMGPGNGGQETSDEGDAGPQRRGKGKERAHSPDCDEEEELLDDDAETEKPDDDSVGDLSDESEGFDRDIPQPIHHWRVWDRLVKQASEISATTYAIEPKSGRDPMDVTAYHPHQASWGLDRASRPAVLSLWLPPNGQNNAIAALGSLKYRGRILLDWEGRNIKAFPNLPLTISSAVEGWRAEAWMREDKRMTYRDIEARMRTQENANGRRFIFGARALATRTKLFRNHAGCVSWKSGGDRTAAGLFMDSLRTPAQRASNQTTDHDLCPAQLNAFREITRNPLRPNATAGTTGATTSVAGHITIPFPHIDVEDDDQESIAASNPFSEPEDITDARNLIPMSITEKRMLTIALEDTVEDFHELTNGQFPRPANPNGDYFSQWWYYQSQFVAMWRQIGSHYQPPTLHGLGKWTGGIVDWTSAPGASIDRLDEEESVTDPNEGIVTQP